MISCAALEQPGRWRWAGVVLVFVGALAPIMPLVAAAGSRGGADWLGGGFGTSLLRSFAVAGGVALTSLAIGLPGGVLAGLYRFPLRRFLLPLLVLPLLAPPFLWALGLSMLRIRLGMPQGGVLEGFSGTTLAFAAGALPLVLFAAMLAMRGLSSGQVDAVRLAGGDRRLFGLALRHVFPVAMLASLLAGVLTLSDPGPGQILGYEGAASQILISFSAAYDFSLAARQSLLLAGLVLIVSLPAAIAFAPRLAAGLPGRATGPAPLSRDRRAGALTLFFVGGILTATFGLAFAGLILPALGNLQLERAWQETARTLPNTLFYAAGAGFLAVLWGCFLALCVGRQPRLRTVALAGLMMVFSLPPSLGALGFVMVASDALPVFDGVLRSRFTVILWLSLRLFPVVAVFAFRSLGSASPTWAMAAAVHGIPLRVYLTRVLFPWLWPAAVTSGLLAGLLAIADISSMLLLHPPGSGSLPLAIFTVMANAPESLVATLCLIYICGSTVVLALAWVTGVHLASKQSGK